MVMRNSFETYILSKIKKLVTNSQFHEKIIENIEHQINEWRSVNPIRVFP
jgi:hypothetical protein